MNEVDLQQYQPTDELYRFPGAKHAKSSFFQRLRYFLMDVLIWLVNCILIFVKIKLSE